ncbi:hypothetical protein ACFSTC_54165 [Nonomuraea ferruginea]
MTAARDDGQAHPIDALIEPMDASLARAVEPLQVAAILESEGLNDKIARERYGHTDVFSLAETAFSRVAAKAVPPVPDAPLRRARPTAQILHGLLYGLPAALLPAASGLVGTQWLMPGLVFTTGIGWVLGSSAAQIAYTLMGRGCPRSAGRVLRTGLVTGVGCAALTATGLALGMGAPVALVALCVTQIAFQISSGILLFYRREAWLAAMMMPAVLAGIGYIGVADRFVGLLTVCLGVICVAAVVGAAMLLTLATPDKGEQPAAEPPLRTLLRANLRGLPPAFLYSLLTALFLLQAEARYVLDRSDIAISRRRAGARHGRAGVPGARLRRRRQGGDPAGELPGRVHLARPVAARQGRARLPGHAVRAVGAAAGVPARHRLGCRTPVSSWLPRTWSSGPPTSWPSCWPTRARSGTCARRRRSPWPSIRGRARC